MQSFFGRTYSNVTAIGECKNGGQCVINKKNRTSCKACRLRKCLLVGMSKSGSRYGRRSNWFKIHCLLQEQTGLEAPLGGANPLLYSGLHPSSFSPDGGHDGSPEDDRARTTSPSSVASSDPSGDDDTSKENVRLLINSAPSYHQVEAPEALELGHHLHLHSQNQRKRTVLRTASPDGSGMSPSSPKAGLLAPSSHAAVLYQQGVSPRLPESSSSGRIGHHLALIPHSLYQLMGRSLSHPLDEGSIYGQDVPEQEGPIDLSFKASSSSPAPPSHSLCHIRAEILTGIGHSIHRDNDGTPLDLTTKS